MRIVYEIKELAQEFMTPPRIERDGKDVLLKFDFEKEDGSYGMTGIRFSGCADYRFTREREIADPEVLSAYNAVAIAENSDWIKACGYDNMESGYIHYKIFFDDFGLYEFIAASFIKLGEL